jgi:hypothetical protein
VPSKRWRRVPGDTVPARSEKKEVIAMSPVMPEGEGVRKAVKWISENLKLSSDQSIQKLINQAIAQFDLSPKDSELLIDFYRTHKE